MKAQDIKSIKAFFMTAGVISFVANCISIFQLLRELYNDTSDFPSDKFASLFVSILITFVFGALFLYIGKDIHKNILLLFGYIYVIYASFFLVIGGYYAMEGLIIGYDQLMSFLIPSIITSAFGFALIHFSEARTKIVIFPFVLSELFLVSWLLFKGFNRVFPQIHSFIFFIIMFGLMILFYQQSEMSGAKIRSESTSNPIKLLRDVLSKAAVGIALGALWGIPIGFIFGAFFGAVFRNSTSNNLWSMVNYAVDGAGIVAIIAAMINGVYAATQKRLSDVFSLPRSIIDFLFRNKY
jgi:hypothetical protein